MLQFHLRFISPSHLWRWIRELKFGSYDVFWWGRLVTSFNYFGYPSQKRGQHLCLYHAGWLSFMSLQIKNLNTYELYLMSSTYLLGRGVQPCWRFLSKLRISHKWASKEKLMEKKPPCASQDINQEVEDLFKTKPTKSPKPNQQPKNPQTTSVNISMHKYWSVFLSLMWLLRFVLPWHFICCSV